MFPWDGVTCVKKLCSSLSSWLVVFLAIMNLFKKLQYVFCFSYFGCVYLTEIFFSHVGLEVYSFVSAKLICFFSATFLAFLCGFGLFGKSEPFVYVATSCSLLCQPATKNMFSLLANPTQLSSTEADHQFPTNSFQGKHAKQR